ncbi:MAG: hypothetical protein SPLUMA1_SPLUMAMAG1_00472 [uncultured Sulfurimonas sp.]|nr:MAG: hypothetical protein SPLUMA1_SPLUMAMAG1_00472 [uncultured Sulfurimonas sp.]
MKTLLKLLYAPLYFLLLSTSVIAAEYTCDGEDVLNLNNATASASKSYSENTNDNGNSGYSRYFKFSTAINGEVTFTIDKHNVEQQIYIGTSCEDDDEFKGDEDKVNVSSTFSVSSSETYYIRIRERNSPEELYFDITFNFTADIAGAVDDSYNTDSNTPLNANVLDNDSGTSITSTILTQPSHGTLSFSSDGSFTYTPYTDFEGDDSFTYTIEDTDGNQDTATVYITISPLNIETEGGRLFELRDQQSLFGDVSMIGNTVICKINPSTGSC